MPFIVSRPGAHNKLYIERDKNGELGWQPNRDRATRFEEAEADKIAADLLVYVSDDVQVEGAKVIVGEGVPS